MNEICIVIGVLLMKFGNGTEKIKRNGEIDRH